jgi:NAD(P)-dependent dehydrogenase (short-subunit alcohol dehydrogenase family)
LNCSKALSKRGRPLGIRSNTVTCGPVATAWWLGKDGAAATVARASGRTPGAVADEAARNTVTGQFPQPSPVADLVILLASERAGNTIGADFIMGGGRIIL